MEYIQYVLKVLIVVFIYIVIIRFIMNVANYIGEKLGFGKFFFKLIAKVKEKIN
jgi:hypothetical protein